MNPFDIDPHVYQNSDPFPHCVYDNILDESFARALQKEILEIPQCDWDRYDNPFEQKFTLRDKYNFPKHLKKLFSIFESEEFIGKISSLSGHTCILDETRNFWGVHTYKSGDKLDIHVDAGVHPTMKLKKQITVGIYLSANWKEEYGCNLELWRGDNAGSNDAKLYDKKISISPNFNRMVIFTCNDYSWHGNPEPVLCPADSQRIFITISYLSNNNDDKNKRVKAYFIKRPNDADDPVKDKLRLLRADPEKYKDIYRV
jgi:Rps23 Pro-64 3,4-dihydroxylase Tpa1-like proline 4-hydroxylase